MKLAFMLTILPCLFTSAFAQKPIIDSTAIESWISAQSPSISNDGEFAMYSIDNQPRGYETIVVKSVDDSWHKECIAEKYSEAFFSSNSKLLFIKDQKSLYFLKLRQDKIDTISNVISYQRPNAGLGDWIAYQTEDANKKLIILNLSTGKRTLIDSVVDYLFDNGGNTLIFKTEITTDSIITVSFNWLNLSQEKRITIWTANGPSTSKFSFLNLTFDKDGNQLLFMVKGNPTDQSGKAIWYYRFGMEKAVTRISDDQVKDEGRLFIREDRSLAFSSNGRWIFFQLKKQTNDSQYNRTSGSVNIWSYKDAILQPAQLLDLKYDLDSYTGVVDTATGKAIIIQGENEMLETYPNEITGDYAVVARNYPFGNKSYNNWWKLSPIPAYFLVSLRDGSEKLLKEESFTLSNFAFSPSGTFLTYFDSKSKAFYTVDILSSHIFNISHRIPTDVCDENPRGLVVQAVGPVLGWTQDETSLFLYDNYDIWKVDSRDSRSPENITNGYGAKHGIKFRLAFQTREPALFRKEDSLLLVAFSPKSKQNGFFRLFLDKKKQDPTLLAMGSYTYYYADVLFEFNYSFQPLKARNSNVWIVRRESFNQAPNFFITKDFRNFQVLSKIHPELSYNWLTAQLLTWKMSTGQTVQGILYKPENFDSHKKYPIIFNYYERLSDRLFEFPGPAFTDANINIPWFVSRGYLVFTPDIYYGTAAKAPKSGAEWACSTVVSAVAYLANIPYIDTRKMALQGHSFGAFETNYIITHTNLFAAASEAAGITDPLSEYLSLTPFPDGREIESWSPEMDREISHTRYKGTPWKYPNLYAKSSAVLHADKISAPLLIMHNRLDDNIQWRQGVELFMALRRLGKRVWMLEYDGETHVLANKDNQKDFTIRLTQFFDHYLKDSLPPIWMTEGIPAKLKGIDLGFKADSSGRCGITCGICFPAQPKYKKLNGFESKRTVDALGRSTTK